MGSRFGSTKGNNNRTDMIDYEDKAIKVSWDYQDDKEVFFKVILHKLKGRTWQFITRQRSYTIPFIEEGIFKVGIIAKKGDGRRSKEAFSREFKWGLLLPTPKNIKIQQ